MLSMNNDNLEEKQLVYHGISTSVGMYNSGCDLCFRSAVK